MIEYRKAALSDAAELARIRGVFLAEAHDMDTADERITALERANLAYFSKALADGSFAAWLAENGGEIVATSGLSFSLAPPTLSCPSGKLAYIMNMFTFSAYRHRGIASELFGRIVGEAKALGCGKITLNATDMGRPLYTKFGFKDAHGEMEYYV